MIKDMRATVSPSPLLMALRPAQWTKNLLVGAAAFFAYGDPGQALPSGTPWRVAAAVLCFCAVSSAVYLLNDLKDRPADRRHPVKRHRPIAAGTVRAPVAVATAVLLGIAGLAGGYALQPTFVLVLGAYLLLQALYSLVLKRAALVDVIVIACGFVLRALGGAVVIGVQISPWLLLCTFLLALFLTLCKRRQEIETLPKGHNPAVQRAALANYDLRLLDQLIAAITAATIGAYAMYTLSEATLRKFGTAGLGLTIPFVVFGLFRYLDLVYRHQRGERPEIILLTDLPLIVNLLLYAAVAAGVFLLRP